jgi:hypothetical protein
MRSLTYSYLREHNKKALVPTILIIITLVTLHSYIVALSAFTSPEKELRWDGIVDYINKPTFSAGETVTIDGLFEQGEDYFQKGTYYFFVESENIRWIAIVKDPNNMPIWMESEAVLNANGDIIVEVTFDLPSNAAPGTYSVKLMVWTDWLPVGETRTYVIHESSFEVVL